MAKRSRKEKLEEALRKAHTQLKDLTNGWPERELFEPPRKTLRRIEKLLGLQKEDL